MEALGIFLAELIKNLPKLVALFDFILNLVQDNPDLQVALNEAIAKAELDNPSADAQAALLARLAELTKALSKRA